MQSQRNRKQGFFLYNISEPYFINRDDEDDDGNDDDDDDDVHNFEEGLQCGVVNPSWSGG